MKLTFSKSHKPLSSEHTLLLNVSIYWNKVAGVRSSVDHCSTTCRVFAHGTYSYTNLKANLRQTNNVVPTRQVHRMQLLQLICKHFALKELREQKADLQSQFTRLQLCWDVVKLDSVSWFETYAVWPLLEFHAVKIEIVFYVLIVFANRFLAMLLFLKDLSGEMKTVEKRTWRSLRAWMQKCCRID